jgi:hypothetical protein
MSNPARYHLAMNSHNEMLLTGKNETTEHCRPGVLTRRPRCCPAHLDPPLRTIFENLPVVLPLFYRLLPPQNLSL